MLNTKVAGKFSVKKKIGAGCFSEIFLSKSLTSEEFALKTEKLSSRNPQLHYESKILKLLQGGAGIPSISWSGSESSHTLLVMELLGPNLEELFTVCNRKFCLKTILMLADQILTRLEFVHSKSYIHRDVKPENFCMGLGKRSSLVYVIDFGMAKKYRNPKSHQHVEYKEGKKIPGNLSFASVSAQNGIEQSRRDDLVAVGYILLYFLRGNLPWIGLGGRDRKERNKLVVDKKQATGLDELCAQHPIEFRSFLEYCLSLKFEESPDYLFLRRMFKGLYVSSGFEEDFLYDWSLMNYMSQKKAKSFVEEEKKEEVKSRNKSQETQVEKKKKKTCVIV